VYLAVTLRTLRLFQQTWVTNLPASFHGTHLKSPTFLPLHQTFSILPAAPPPPKHTHRPPLHGEHFIAMGDAPLLETWSVSHSVAAFWGAAAPLAAHKPQFKHLTRKADCLFMQKILSPSPNFPVGRPCQESGCIRLCNPGNIWLIWQCKISQAECKRKTLSLPCPARQKVRIYCLLRRFAIAPF